MMLTYEQLSLQNYALCDRLNTRITPVELDLQPLVPAALQDSERLMPAIADLALLKPAARIALLCQLNEQTFAGESPCLCAMLQSTAEPERVMAHLRRHMVVETSEGLVYFRYFDPRVLVQLSWLLLRSQLSALMGPVTAWTFYLDGAWHTLARPDDHPTLRWRPDARQSFAMEHMLTTNALIARLQPRDVQHRQELGRAILALFQRAFAAGLRTSPDLETFAWHGLNVHPRFDEHPLIRDVLAKLPDDADYPYQDACSDLEDSDWARVHRELNEHAEVS